MCKIYRYSIKFLATQSLFHKIPILIRVYFRTRFHIVYKSVSPLYKYHTISDIKRLINHYEGNLITGKQEI